MTTQQNFYKLKTANIPLSAKRSTPKTKALPLTCLFLWLKGEISPYISYVTKRQDSFHVPKLKGNNPRKKGNPKDEFGWKRNLRNYIEEKTSSLYMEINN